MVKDKVCWHSEVIRSSKEYIFAIFFDFFRVVMTDLRGIEGLRAGNPMGNDIVNDIGRY